MRQIIGTTNEREQRYVGALHRDGGRGRGRHTGGRYGGRYGGRHGGPGYQSDRSTGGSSGRGQYNRAARGGRQSYVTKFIYSE